MKIINEGDFVLCDEHRAYAQLQMDMLKKQMSFRGLLQGKRVLPLGDGRFIECSVAGGNENINVIIPPRPKVPREMITIKKEKDVLIAFNTPIRCGAFDLANGMEIQQYKQDIPMNSWSMEEFNTRSVEGDPIVYYYPHTVSSDNDSRFNVLKSWTYNLGTRVNLPPAISEDTIPTESITIFHRKSVSFNDVNHSVDDSLFWYETYGESIDVYTSVGAEGSPAPRLIYSDLDSAMNFYVHSNGDFSIVKFKPYMYGDNVHIKYTLNVKKYSRTGTLLSNDSYISDPTNGVLVDGIDNLGPLSVMYDGSDFYCTVNVGDTAGGWLDGKVEFSESFIHTSAVKLYDWDPVNRVKVEYDKVGYVSGDTRPDVFYLGVVSWFDFAKGVWKSIDVLCNNDGSGKTFTYNEDAVPTTVFTQYSSSPLSQQTLTDIASHFDVNPIFHFLYPLFPNHPSPYSAHYTVAGYNEIITGDRTAVFSQRYVVKPDTTTGLVNYFRPMMSVSAIADWTPPGTPVLITGECAKWVTNGLILQVSKIDIRMKEKTNA